MINNVIDNESVFTETAHYPSCTSGTKLSNRIRVLNNQIYPLLAPRTSHTINNSVSMSNGRFEMWNETDDNRNQKFALKWLIGITFYCKEATISLDDSSSLTKKKLLANSEVVVHLFF